MRNAALVVLVVFAAGCGPTNIGEGCDRLGQTLCDRQVACTGDSSSKSDCLRGFYGNCCAGSACTGAVPDQEKFATCRSQLSTLSCTLLAQVVLPSVCFGVLSPPVPPVVLGGTCPTENVGRCDSAARLLQCTNGKFTLYADCKGPRGCSVTNDTGDCDTSGNVQGDHCAPTSEGKVRCDPVTPANILKCTNGILALEYACSSPTPTCGTNSMGQLTCI